MFILKSICVRLLVVLATLLSLSGMANATLIFSGDLALQATDPTQLGRLSRNGVSSDWSAPSPFPGIVNTGTSYHYTTLTLDLDVLEAGYDFGSFFQVTIDSLSTNTFLSAYLNTYDPLNKATNYLADPGTSGNYFGTDPLYFQFMVGSTDDLVLLFNATFTSNYFDTARIMVEAFSDTEYSDLIASQTVPEPSSILLILLCLVALGGIQMSKVRRSATVSTVPLAI